MKRFLQRILQEIMKKKNNTWNIRRLVDESFTQRPSVLYWRLSDFLSKQKIAGWCKSKCEFIMTLAELCRRKKFDERNSLSSHWNTRKNFLLMMIDFLNKVFPYFFSLFSVSLLKIMIFHEILFFVFELIGNLDDF